MLVVTSSPNDKKLAAGLSKIGVVGDIPYGDVFWVGRWTGDKPVWVCGDRKRMYDFLNCVESGHHVQQLQDARNAGMDLIFVIWEKDVKIHVNKQGLVCFFSKSKKGWVPRIPHLHINRVLAYVNELEWYQGVHVIETTSLRETVRRITTLHTLFLTPPEDHHALNLFYNPAPIKEVGVFKRPSLVRRVAKELEGIGWEKSKLIEGEFDSVMDLATAPVERWEDIKGIGDKVAMRAVQQLRGEV